MARLLILSCSSRKRRDAGLLPALRRYDGPAYRTVRRFLRECGADALDIKVLSAEFGLIAGNHPIPWYDRRMTDERAGELRADVSAVVGDLLQQIQYQDILVYGGAVYRSVLDGTVSADPRIKMTSGSIGHQLSSLKAWLYAVPAIDHSAKPAKLARSAPRIRGVTLALTAADVLERARASLAAGSGHADRSTTWYVDVDGRPVGVKWLVSQLTALPPSAFVTTEARRVLEQIGIEVRRA